ncbi:MAG: hypothetical protein L6Q66_06275 [Bacteroidia bacterium]|nr:hypothetical protein [Bacteroidia bacterium]
MKMSFKALLDQLKKICNKYDTVSEEQKSNLLISLMKSKLPASNILSDYQNVLLFIIAHPSDKNILALAEQELNRLSTHIKRMNKTDVYALDNSGLPNTRTVSTFSHDLLKWYQSDKNVNIKIDSFYKSTLSLNDVLQFTLPSLEKEVTAIGYKNNQLFDALKVEKEQQLAFLLSEFDRLNDKPYIKDHLFGGLHLYVKLLPASKLFSKACNRIAIKDPFYHKEIIKQFDQVELLNRKLPKERVFKATEKKDLITCIKNSLTLLQRETDPVSYMDEDSLRLFELEHGISIAIFGMTADRQLPLESYVGYTLFKNGLPAAYGGGWVFGNRSLFGINIFEPYRGGESGFMMCQLLRVYRQAFGVDYFEVEPYQYGLGNPEGISSGAYWFYFRFGFRSLDKELNALSLKEFEKIKTQKGYRSSEETLLRFTESNIALNMGKSIPLQISEIRDKVTLLITERYSGNRMLAEKEVIANFVKKAGKLKSFSVDQKKVLIEVAFFCEVLQIKTASKLSLMQQLVYLKPVDLYAYQKVLKQVLS